MTGMADEHSAGPSTDRPAAENLAERLWRRSRWLVRSLRPHRWVTREIRGVEMAMPWSHRLPDYAKADPAYGQNLNDLAALMGSHAGRSINVLDVGANIGDSALLLLAHAPARVLAVEPDEVYLPFLKHNVRGRADIIVEPSLLVVDPSSSGRRAVRRGGTAAYVEDATSASTPQVMTVAELRTAHPEFGELDLVKSDTDGYDVRLVPEIAGIWAESRPVLFFEYDHRLSRQAGLDPVNVWGELEKLGYAECAIWDNGGHPLHRLTLADAAALAVTTDPQSPQLFWDVAAVHEEDANGLRAIDELVPRR